MHAGAVLIFLGVLLLTIIIHRMTEQEQREWVPVEPWDGDVADGEDEGESQREELWLWL